VGALIAVVTGFMGRYKFAGRTFGLLPGPGSGYVQRLGVNVLAIFPDPLIVLTASWMLLRAKSFTDSVWLRWYWLNTAVYLVMFVAALMVAWTWFTTRALERPDPLDAPGDDVPYV
jgi:hypothetical protein